MKWEEYKEEYKEVNGILLLELHDAETMSIGHHKVLIFILKVINNIVLKHGGSDWPQPLNMNGGISI